MSIMPARKSYSKFSRYLLTCAPEDSKIDAEGGGADATRVHPVVRIKRPNGMFGGDEIEPRETNTWYDFRVNYQKARTVISRLTDAAPLACTSYFAFKEALTDENGVFDLQQAEAMYTPMTLD